jgi:hypothetical protein
MRLVHRINFARPPLSLVGQRSEQLGDFRIGNLRSQLVTLDDLILNRDQQFKVLAHVNPGGFNSPSIHPALSDFIESRAAVTVMV